DKAHLLLGALVRNVLRRGTDRLPRLPAAVRRAALGRPVGWSSRWIPFAGGALAVGVVALVVVVIARSGKALSYTRSGAQLRFSDGSDVAVGRDGRVEVLGTTDRGGHLRLRAGSAQVRLAGRAGAVWTIDAGPYTIAAARATL